MSELIELSEILAARERIAGVAVRTPLVRLDTERLAAMGIAAPAAEIWLKDESKQPIGSFKLRGAYNKVAQLSAEELKRGVITYSSGNHAQGGCVCGPGVGSKGGDCDAFECSAGEAGGDAGAGGGDCAGGGGLERAAAEG